MSGQSFLRRSAGNITGIAIPILAVTGTVKGEYILDPKLPIVPLVIASWMAAGIVGSIVGFMTASRIKYPEGVPPDYESNSFNDGTYAYGSGNPYHNDSKPPLP